MKINKFILDVHAHKCIPCNEVYFKKLLLY